MHWRDDDRSALPWIIAGLALYLVMFIITGRINIPLNNELMPPVIRGASPTSTLCAVRFEDKWVAWNIVRTIANVAACCCLAYALIVSGRSTASDDAEATTAAAAIATNHVVTGSD